MEQTTTLHKPMYQIQQEHLSLESMLEESGGELTPEIETALSLTYEEFKEKAISTAFVTKSMDDKILIINKEIARLKELLDRVERSHELIKTRLSEAMIQFGVEKIETPTLKLSFRKSEVVEITDESKVPFAYVVEKVTKTISKSKLKEDLKAGVKIPGAELLTKDNLQIR